MTSVRRAATPRPIVKPSEIAPAEWNLFVYLNGDNNLEGFAKGDLNEMEEAGSVAGKLNVIALVDGWGSRGKDADGWDSKTHLMLVQRDPFHSRTIMSREIEVDPGSDLGQLLAEGNGELDLGDPKVMNTALKYVQREIPSKHLMVDMWDHGSAWQIASSDDSGTDMNPEQGELSAALDGVKVDVLGFDECLMGALEIAEIAQRSGATAMVASEYLEPATGWDYKDLLTRYADLFATRPEVTGWDLASAAVSSYQRGGYRNTQLAAVKLTQVPELRARLDALADAILADGGFENAAAKAAYQTAARADGASYQMDIGDFARKLAASAAPKPIRTAASALFDQVAATCRSANGSGSSAGEYSTGLTIYAPGTAVDPSYLSNDQLPWHTARWNELINTVSASPFDHLNTAPLPPWPTR